MHRDSKRFQQQVRGTCICRHRHRHKRHEQTLFCPPPTPPPAGIRPFSALKYTQIDLQEYFKRPFVDLRPDFVIKIQKALFKVLCEFFDNPINSKVGLEDATIDHGHLRAEENQIHDKPSILRWGWERHKRR